MSPPVRTLADGDGFVRADVPELSLCVLPGYRGAGLARPWSEPRSSRHAAGP